MTVSVFLADPERDDPKAVPHVRLMIFLPPTHAPLHEPLLLTEVQQLVPVILQDARVISF